jgi:hypothetical protein
MSYTGFKLGNSPLHSFDGAAVEVVFGPRNEAQIPWFVALVNVDAVHVE